MTPRIPGNVSRWLVDSSFVTLPQQTTLLFDHLVGAGECAPTHFNCRMTVPSEMVGAAAPMFPAFLPTQSRATRTLSSAPALS